MCMVSAMIDSLRQIPQPQWTPQTWDRAQEILDAVRRLDEKLGQKDCEDPKKAEWMREVEDRLRKLEMTNMQNGYLAGQMGLPGR